MKFFFHSMDLAPRLNVDPARLIGLVLSLVLLPFQASNAAGTGFSPLGERQIPGLTELSGLAVSGLQQDHHWALNDSGHAASLFELDENLNLVREIAISQVLNRDWEDLASFQLDGIPYLLVADTGNNFRLRSEVSLILLREPAPGASRATPERIIRFRFEDGSRDCEALAVDVQNRQILLADKGRKPGGLYRLPLDAEPGQVHTAKRIADIPAFSPLSRDTPTAMDLSADGRTLALAGTGHLSIFTRASGQTWQSAVEQPQRQLRLPRVRGIESIAWNHDGTAVLIGTEGQTAKFFRMHLSRVRSSKSTTP